MKGIVLAGGMGTRLNPLTKVINKHLLPVYNKPMIYYSLSVLMLAEIRDILIITNIKDINAFKKLLGDGKNLGIKISYAVQEKPNGIGEAFMIGEKFIGKSSVALVLGDNIFYGQFFYNSLLNAKKNKNVATLFLYRVKDPSNFGVAELNSNQSKILKLTEKPKKPKSNYIVTGLYFYDNSIIQVAKKNKFSKRGELEITSINNYYLRKNKLKFEILGRGFAWLDTGSHNSLMQSSNFVKTIEEQQGFFISCIEEIAFRNGWINSNQLRKLSKNYNGSNYSNYLIEISKN